MKFKSLSIGVLVVTAVAGGWFAVRHLQASQSVALATPVSATPETRNAQRKIDVVLLAGAINTYIVDHGSLPIKIGTVPKAICSSISVNCAKAKLVDLNFLSATGVYIKSIPSDPVGVHSAYSTGFFIATEITTGKIVVSAPNAELGALLSASTR